MKLDTNKKIVDFDGNTIKQAVQGPKDEAGHATVIQEELTYKAVLVNAILLEDPKNPTAGMEKVSLFSLAERIHRQDEVSLSAEEVATIKKRLLVTYATLIAGQVVQTLEGE